MSAGQTDKIDRQTWLHQSTDCDWLWCNQVNRVKVSLYVHICCQCNTTVLLQVFYNRTESAFMEIPCAEPGKIPVFRNWFHVLSAHCKTIVSPYFSYIIMLVQHQAFEAEISNYQLWLGQYMGDPLVSLV